MSGWVVHKFGGTSVANLERIQRVAAILRAEPGENKAIVVSALAGVTDALHELAERAATRDDSYLPKLRGLEVRHLELLEQAQLGAHGARLAEMIRGDGRDLADILRAVWLGRACSEGTLELIAGYGELWSTQILQAVLQQLGTPTGYLDAREVLVIEPAEIGVSIDWSTSKERLTAALVPKKERLLVIPGYVASTKAGVPTTLKRNGSDYSASIFGALLEATAITIWTDVDGVLSADPRRVPEAVVLDELSYDEAMELAYFGAKVVHPKTMAPAVDRQIPIWIRNTFAPEKRGTRIGPARPRGASSVRQAVKGFSTVDGVALLNLEGTGMVGVPGVAQRLFGALREVGVSVIMISQASSEHSICFAVPEKSVELARATVLRAFAEELRVGQIQRVDSTEACSILAAVGDGMVETRGVAATFFAALARAGVNVRAIAQGSSERNISVVIDRDQSTRALRAAHAGFYLSDQTISLGIIGAGLVGATFLSQLEAQAETLRRESRVDLRVRGILNSKRMLLAEPSVELARWKEGFAASPSGPDLDAFEQHVRAEHLPHAAIVDLSADDGLAERYSGWLARGIHVITPNKRAGAGPLLRYQAIKDAAKARRTHFYYEATVGAGLPVISTLRDLIQTGDRVLRIEGILSGTISYLFGELGPGRRFSEIVTAAKKLGYTEPDPRDDLSGRDVARKLVILAREMGRTIELDEVRVQSLVPKELEGLGSAEEFLAELPRFDQSMEQRRQEAEEAGDVLRYVGTVGPEGPATVELRPYPKAHAFARVAAGDNILAFTTTRYATHPLIVQGPGAGPEVTAGGVFADLLRLAAHLGAPT